MVKSLPAVQETWVQFLGREDPLEKEMATHSSILAWKIPWQATVCGVAGLSNFNFTFFQYKHVSFSLTAICII